jgi:hypothetical protein
LDLSRPDGDQNLSRLKVTTPPGFSATLKGVPYCPESTIARLESSTYSGLAEQLSPSCPAASQIGTATAGVGAGTHPLYVGGRVYLGGPYKGAPLSLETVIPALSGPYDLGVVAVRSAIEVDPQSAQVKTVSDPLPQIIEGIPLRTRYIRIDLDRKGFALNPTNCDPFAIDAAITGDEGAGSNQSIRFQVANCAALAYRPKLALRLTGGLGRLGHPAIHANLTSKPGEANSHRISVTLPAGELLDNAHIGSVCTKVAFATNTCPASSLIGHVRVTTPLLDQPLSGSVYLRSSRSSLPDIALDLEGQFDFEAAGRVDSVDGRYRATFESVPDVPVSAIALNLSGGHKGLLQNSESLCGTHKKATVSMVGQNGKTVRQKILLGAECGKARHKHHRQGRSVLRTGRGV